MTDVQNPIETEKPVEAKPVEAPDPAQQRQQALQHMVGEIEMGKRHLVITLLNLTDAAFSLLPRPDEQEEKKGKKPAPKRLLTAADLEKVSKIVSMLMDAAAKADSLGNAGMGRMMHPGMMMR